MSNGGFLISQVKQLSFYTFYGITIIFLLKKYPFSQNLLKQH